MAASKQLPRVVFGLLGLTLDAGLGRRRNQRWRPTVSLCQQADFPIARLELFYQGGNEELLAAISGDIAQISPTTEVVARRLDFSDPWDLQEVYEKLHDICSTYPFDEAKESYFAHITTGTHVMQICMFLLAESKRLPGKLIQTNPLGRTGKSADGSYQVIDLELANYDRLAARFSKERQAGQDLLKSGIATENKAFNQLISQIEKISLQTTDPLLLTGPTGAGKSQLARKIFELKKQRRQLRGEFVEVNCATLRGDGALSMLFGHVRGAFTGAAGDRAGLLKAADKGLLFLDEIGELGLDEQALLLRAIEDKTYYPVGSDRPMQSDFQLIAGTNRNLSQSVHAGTFREDLLARISLWHFKLPGLRERPEDIAPNLAHELMLASSRVRTHVTMNLPARTRFLQFASSHEASWKANFRDLNGAVVRMATLCEGGRITVADVEHEIERLLATWHEPSNRQPLSTPDDERIAEQLMPASLDQFECVQLRYVLKVCLQAPSLADAGRQLFEYSRVKRQRTNDSDRLRKYLLSHGITWPQIQAAKSQSSLT